MIKMPIVLLDPGHGKDTPGKCSPDASNGLVKSPLYFREYQWARKAAAGIASVLTFDGYTAFLLVKEEEDIPLRTRTERIKAYCRQYGTENVIVVSIHVNAAAGDRKWHDARGLAIYTSPGKTKSDTLATCIYDAAVEELIERTYGHPYGSTFGPEDGKQKPIRADWSDGDPDYEAAFWMLVQHPAVAVLVEHMFQDNKEDVAFLKSDEGLGSCIHLNVQGIENYIEKHWKK
ncbi:MAG: N-acetylmuramoyl-L-alanine amidase [Bacteroidales bacterium]|nr:N-acetylmuramoyl-L-alanine amidase [Bacteroidales bacterium]